MWGVGFVGVGCAALAHPSVFWESTLFTLAIMALAVATAMALARHDRSRFWLGFAVCGWIYFAFAFFWGHRMSGGIPFLLPTLVIHIHVSFKDDFASFAQPQPSYLFNIGHSLVTLAFAALGGLIAARRGSTDTPC